MNATEITKLDDQCIHEILRLANKVPSPRSITSTLELPDDNTARANKLACDFAYRIIDMTMQMMGHFGRMTVHPVFVSQALEYFVKFDVTSYRHSYMLDDDVTSSNDKVDESEDSQEDSAFSSDNVKDEVMHDDDDELCEGDGDIDNDEVEDDDDEESIYEDMDLNNKFTPTFDSSFTPVGKINFPDEAFHLGMIQDIMGSFKTDLQWVDGADGKLKNAMFAYVVAQMQ